MQKPVSTNKTEDPSVRAVGKETSINPKEPKGTLSNQRDHKEQL